MRLIACFGDEERAYALHAVFIESEIEGSVSSIREASTGATQYQVWIVREEDRDKALDIYEAWNQNPGQFVHQHKKILENKEEEPLIKGPIKVKATSSLFFLRKRAPITRWVVILCVIMFLWNGYQKGILSKNHPALMEYFGLTSLTMQMMYDVPAVFQEIYQFFIAHPELKVEEMEHWPQEVQSELTRLGQIPYWQGIYEYFVPESASHQSVDVSLFTQIAQGEIWRLFTPALLHGNFLHILFNMLWLWMLGKEMESKVGPLRYLVVMLLLGVICNTAQYLVSGPLFMGYSGVICGLGGFIWVRQKKAPWEGYSIPQGTLLFLFIFILGMLVLQMVSLILSKMQLGEFSVGNIGNTAHIVGAVTGLLLARIPLFYRLKS